MRDTVGVVVAGARDAYDQPAAGSTRYVKARVVPSLRMNTDETFPSGYVVLMEDVPELDTHASLILPDGTTRSIKTVTRPSWPNGARHLRVEV
jgi:hypothetical protein